MPKGIFLRIIEGSHTFLLASDEAVALEPRDRALEEIAEQAVTAWYTVQVRH